MNSDSVFLHSLSGLPDKSERGPSGDDIHPMASSPIASEPHVLSAVAPADGPFSWPTLEQLKLGAAEQRARLTGIGGSDANIILSGDREKIVNLWRVKSNAVTTPDLSDSLPVQLGCWTESFNRQWFEKITGQKIDCAGTSICCSTYSWRRCTLDGWVQSTGAVWEAKHTNAFAKPEEVLERYMPQLQHNMAVAKAESAVLSVIFGNHKFEIFNIAADWLYQLDLLQAEEDFWDCVLSGREPVPAPVPPAPRPIGTRAVCLEGNLAIERPRLSWKPSMASPRIPKRLGRSRRRPEGRECPAHRAWVRRHHCSVPGCDRLPIECAHVRGGTDGGIGLKPSDCWVISLCSFHHEEQHLVGEQEFESRHRLDLLGLAEEFRSRSPHWNKLRVQPALGDPDCKGR